MPKPWEEIPDVYDRPDAPPAITTPPSAGAAAGSRKPWEEIPDLSEANAATNETPGPPSPAQRETAWYEDLLDLGTSALHGLSLGTLDDVVRLNARSLGGVPPSWGEEQAPQGNGPRLDQTITRAAERYPLADLAGRMTTGAAASMAAPATLAGQMGGGAMVGGGQVLGDPREGESMPAYLGRGAGAMTLDAALSGAGHLAAQGARWLLSGAKPPAAIAAEGSPPPSDAPAARSAYEVDQEALAARLAADPRPDARAGWEAPRRPPTPDAEPIELPPYEPPTRPTAFSEGELVRHGDYAPGSLVDAPRGTPPEMARPQYRTTEQWRPESEDELLARTIVRRGEDMSPAALELEQSPPMLRPDRMAKTGHGPEPYEEPDLYSPDTAGVYRPEPRPKPVRDPVTRKFVSKARAAEMKQEASAARIAQLRAQEPIELPAEERRQIFEGVSRERVGPYPEQAPLELDKTAWSREPVPEQELITRPGDAAWFDEFPASGARPAPRTPAFHAADPVTKRAAEAIARDMQTVAPTKSATPGPAALANDKVRAAAQDLLKEFPFAARMGRIGRKASTLGNAIADTRIPNDAAAAFIHSGAGAIGAGASAATTPTLTWVVQSVLTSPSASLSPQQQQQLTAAVVSGDDQQLAAAHFKLMSTNPAYAREIESGLREIGEGT